MLKSHRSQFYLIIYRSALLNWYRLKQKLKLSIFLSGLLNQGFNYLGYVLIEIKDAFLHQDS